MREFNLDKIKATGTTVGDAYFPHTKLLLPFNGANGATTTSDLSNTNATVTFNGTAQISTAQSKFGGSSLLLDGDSDYLTIAASSNLSFDADFTIECWVKTSNSAVDTQWRRIFMLGSSNGADNLQIVFDSSNYGNVYSNTTLITGNITLTDGNWHHIVLCRSGTNLRYFVDGVQSGSTATTSQNFTGGADEGVWIGKYGVGAGHFDGYIDDFRITKGLARYTSNFTPPTSAHLTSAGDVNKQIIVNSAADGVAIGTGGINQSRIAKAWCNINGTGTISIRGSYNVSSLTDVGTGKYKVNFSTAMTDSNYVGFVAGAEVNSGTVQNHLFHLKRETPLSDILNTAYIYVASANSANTATDDGLFCVIVFGN